MVVDGDGLEVPRELAGLVVPRRGSLEATGDLFQPYRLVDGAGAVVVPVAAFFAELAARGRPATTQRSYGMDGPVALVPVLVDARDGVGSGDSGRGARFLPLVASQCQTDAALAPSGR